MEKIVQLTGYSTKSGSGARGPWTLHMFTDAANEKFQTFDGGLANRAGQMMHQPARVVFDVEMNGQYANNVLKAIELAPGAVVQQPQQQPTQNGSAPQQSTSTDDSKRRWAASQVAVTWLGFLPDHERTIESLVVLSEQLIKYYQHGPNAFVGSSPVTDVGAAAYGGAYNGDPVYTG